MKQQHLQELDLEEQKILDLKKHPGTITTKRNAERYYKQAPCLRDVNRYILKEEDDNLAKSIFKRSMAKFSSASLNLIDGTLLLFENNQNSNIPTKLPKSIQKIENRIQRCSRVMSLKKEKTLSGSNTSSYAYITQSNQENEEEQQRSILQPSEGQKDQYMVNQKSVQTNLGEEKIISGRGELIEAQLNRDQIYSQDFRQLVLKKKYIQQYSHIKKSLVQNFFYINQPKLQISPSIQTVPIAPIDSQESLIRILTKEMTPLNNYVLLPRFKTVKSPKEAQIDQYLVILITLNYLIKKDYRPIIQKLKLPDIASLRNLMIKEYEVQKAIRVELDFKTKFTIT